eukprot:scaffold2246_cov19-Prasinocladus_malaysianus.AAC.1
MALVHSNSRVFIVVQQQIRNECLHFSEAPEKCRSRQRPFKPKSLVPVKDASVAWVPNTFKMGIQACIEKCCGHRSDKTTAFSSDF